MSLLLFTLSAAPGSHSDSLPTPPVTPASDGPAFTPTALHPSSPQPSSPAPSSSPPPVPAVTPSVKKAPGSLSPNPASPPYTKNSSNSLTGEPRAGLVHSQVKGQASLGRNGTPPTSTPRNLLSQRKPGAPKSLPLSQCSVSPLLGSSSERSWREERDSGLSGSLLGGGESRGESRGEGLEKLLEECKTTLGLSGSQDGATSSTAGQSEFWISQSAASNTLNSV